VCRSCLETVPFQEIARPGRSFYGVLSLSSSYSARLASRPLDYGNTTPSLGTISAFLSNRLPKFVRASSTDDFSEVGITHPREIILSLAEVTHVLPKIRRRYKGGYIVMIT
jgi:hypothetical protein